MMEDFDLPRLIEPSTTELPWPNDEEPTTQETEPLLSVTSEMINRKDESSKDELWLAYLEQQHQLWDEYLHACGSY